MAAIDRDQLLLDADNWLPEGNLLTDTQEDYFLDLVITQVGDDDENYAEVLCKYLNVVADVNLAKINDNPDGYTRERLGKHEVYYGDYSSRASAWEAFKKNLSNICPMFGYSPKKFTGKIKINPGESYNPLDR